MAYEHPCVFPQTDPEQLRLAFGGCPLTYGEVKRWYAVLSGKRKKWPIIGLAVMGIFGLQTWLLLSFNTRTVGVESLIPLLLLLAAFVTAVITLITACNHVKRRELQEYDRYAADAAMHRAGTWIALYGNRVEQHTLRGVTVLRFEDVCACVETYDGFALTDGDRWVILRAQDLTPTAACTVHAVLEEALCEMWQVIESARPLLRELLPLPQISEAPAPLCTATLPHQPADRKEFQLLMVFSQALAVVAALTTACMISVTEWFLADAALFIAVFAAVVWLFSLVMHARFRTKPPKTVTVQWFSEGLSITAEGRSRYYAASLCLVTVLQNGMYIRFWNKETLSIPYEAVDHPEALQALMGVPPASSYSMSPQGK